MNICNANGYQIAVMLRDEHCPPHVHVDGGTWVIRILFSFCHSDTSFWDVKPSIKKPNKRVVDQLCNELKQTKNLCKARQVWMQAVGQTCMNNKYWDSTKQELSNTGCKILSSTYNTQENITILEIANMKECVEVKL